LRQPDHACLFRDERDVAVIARNVDHIRLSGSNRAQLSFEIRIALRVRLLAHDATTEPREAEFEVVRQSFAVRRVEVEKDRSLLCFETVNGKARHHLTLKRIDKARAKDVIARLRHGGIGRRRRDHRNMRPLCFGRSSATVARRAARDDRDDFVLVDEVGSQSCGFFRATFIVVDDDVDLPAVDAA
jgi:hypothetical protein